MHSARNASVVTLAGLWLILGQLAPQARAVHECSQPECQVYDGHGAIALLDCETEYSNIDIEEACEDACAEMNQSGECAGYTDGYEGHVDHGCQQGVGGWNFELHCCCTTEFPECEQQ